MKSLDVVFVKVFISVCVEVVNVNLKLFLRNEVGGEGEVFGEVVIDGWIIDGEYVVYG